MQRDIWMTAALWFSNPPDPPVGLESTAAEKNLGKAVCKNTLAPNETCRKISKSHQILASSGAFSVSVFSISALPKSPFSPATPISPPSGPTQWLFQEPPAKSKLLAGKANF